MSAVTVTTTAEHISRARAMGIHPVSLAVLDAMPGFEDADILADRAICWVGVRSTDLLFSEEGRGFVLACDCHEAAGPFTFTAEVAA